jgi:hypothetical protein
MSQTHNYRIKSEIHSNFEPSLHSTMIDFYCLVTALPPTEQWAVD